MLSDRRAKNTLGSSVSLGSCNAAKVSGKTIGRLRHQADKIRAVPPLVPESPGVSNKWVRPRRGWNGVEFIPMAESASIVPTEEPSPLRSLKSEDEGPDGQKFRGMRDISTKEEQSFMEQTTFIRGHRGKSDPRD